MTMLVGGNPTISHRQTLRNLDYSLGTLKVKRLGEGTVFLVPFFFGLMK